MQLPHTYARGTPLTVRACVVPGAQVHGLRKAFSTLSDVLIEEVDVIRSEAAERHDETQKQLAAQAKAPLATPLTTSLAGATDRPHR